VSRTVWVGWRRLERGLVWADRNIQHCWKIPAKMGGGGGKEENENRKKVSPPVQRKPGEGRLVAWDESRGWKSDSDEKKGGE